MPLLFPRHGSPVGMSSPVPDTIITHPAAAAAIIAPQVCLQQCFARFNELGDRLVALDADACTGDVRVRAHTALKLVQARLEASHRLLRQLETLHSSLQAKLLQRKRARTRRLLKFLYQARIADLQARIAEVEKHREDQLAAHALLVETHAARLEEWERAVNLDEERAAVKAERDQIFDLLINRFGSTEHLRELQSKQAALQREWNADAKLLDDMRAAFADFRDAQQLLASARRCLDEMRTSQQQQHANEAWKAEQQAEARRLGAQALRTLIRAWSTVPDCTHTRFPIHARDLQCNSITAFHGNMGEDVKDMEVFTEWERAAHVHAQAAGLHIVPQLEASKHLLGLKLARCTAALEEERREIFDRVSY